MTYTWLRSWLYNGKNPLPLELGLSVDDGCDPRHCFGALTFCLLIS